MLVLSIVCVVSGAEIAVGRADRHRVGDAPSCTSSSSAIPGGPGHRPIAGWAFIGRGYELSHATVSLWTLRGRRIPDASTRTGSTGVFTLSPRARDLPGTFVVRVGGGFIAHRRQSRSFAFSALVHRRDLRRIVFVGLASTVLLDYLRAHPRVSERTARVRVRRILGIPAWHNLGYDLYNISRSWYSAAKVMRVAAARGGMRKLVSALVRAVASGDRAGRPPFQGASQGAAVRARAELVLQKRSPVAHAAQATWFLQQLAGGVISAAAGRGAGWVFDQVGFSSNPSYVDDIERQLNQLAAEISQLQDEIAALNTAVQESYYAQQSNNLTAARAALDTAMEDMAYIPGIADDAHREYWSQTYFCQDIKPLATNQKPWGSTRVLIDDVLVDVPPFEKPLGLQGAIYIESQDPFWSSTDSQNVWQIVDFWNQYAVEALDVYLEYQHAIGAEQYCDDPPTDAGCPLQKETDLTSQLATNAMATLKDSQGRPLNPMPDGYTIDIRTGLMWCMFCWPTPALLQDAEAQLPNGVYGGLPVLAFKNFTVPNMGQWRALMSGCGCDANHPTGIQWLVDKAGLAPSWLQAPQLPAFAPGLVMALHPDTYNNTFDLRTMNQWNLGPYSYLMYYLPVRVPSSSELPFYP